MESSLLGFKTDGTTSMVSLLTPFLISYNPSTPRYDVNISQLIRYARACSEYLASGRLLTTKLWQYVRP